MAAARAHLKATAASLGLSADFSDLNVTRVRGSLGADIVRFRQAHQGIPVFGGYVTVSLPKGGGQPLVFSSYVPGPALSGAATYDPRWDLDASGFINLADFNLISTVRPGMLNFERAWTQQCPSAVI